MTQSPARILAIAQLLIDVLEDLTDRPPERLCRSECDLAALLIPELDDLRQIRDRARAEMSQLAPDVMAT